jgi:hypothetical protein
MLNYQRVPSKIYRLFPVICLTNSRIGWSGFHIFPTPSEDRTTVWDDSCDEVPDYHDR